MTEQFLWGSFPFTEGYKIQGLTKGLDLHSVEAMLNSIEKEQRHLTGELAKESSEGDLLSLMGMDLPRGQRMFACAFSTGYDDKGRPGVYGIHGIIEHSDNSISLLDQFEELIKDKAFRLRWLQQDLSTFEQRSSQPIDFGNYSFQMDKAIAWLKLAHQELENAPKKHKLSPIYVVDGQVYPKFEASDTGPVGKRRLSFGRKWLIVALIILICVGLIAVSQFLQAPQPLPPMPLPVKPPLVSEQPRNSPETVNKALKYLSRKWNVNEAHVYEKDSVIFLSNLLNNVIQRIPEKQETAKLLSWINNSPNRDLAESAGQLNRLIKIESAFKKALGILNTAKPNNDDFEAYFHELAEFLTNEEAFRGSSENIAFDIQEKLEKETNAISLGRIKSILRRSGELEENQKKALLETLEGHVRFLDTLAGRYRTDL